ncbi:MAG: hypothetical protein GY856_07585 [bacterium]|nr:hypothetical protein [bacterium]
MLVVMDWCLRCHVRPTCCVTPAGDELVADPEQRLSELPLGAAVGAPEASRPRPNRRQRRAERQARLTPEQR